jgi:exosome complex RNA-binding protein Rrp4
MWNVKTEVIRVIIGANGIIPVDSENTWATNRESANSRKYRKHPHWALHTYFGKYCCKNTIHSAWEITFHVT